MRLRTFWSRLFPRQSPRAAPHDRRPRPRLEHLEDRTLLSATLRFDPASGALDLRGDGGGNTIRQALSPAGFLEVVVAGRTHSSDPTSPLFDRALAGATGSTLAGIRLEGGGQSTLVVGSQKLPGSLRVSSDAEVLTEDVTVAGQLAVQAPAVTVTGVLRGGGVALAGSGGVTVEAGGRLAADRIDVSAGVFVNGGQLHAGGRAGGRVFVNADNVLNAGRISADGGGTVSVAFTGSSIDTAGAVTSADGAHGGSVTVDGGGTGRLFSSGTLRATGASGGAVTLLGREVVLAGARVDASGDAVGGSVRVGGDSQGRNATFTNSRAVTVTAAAALRADARGRGDGGRVTVWSDQETTFQGSVSARGGPGGGAGGFIEVSGKGSLKYGGAADAGAPGGRAGTLLLDPKNLIVSAAPAGVLPQYDLIDPHPTAGGRFGGGVTVLSNGNVVVPNLTDDFGGANAGAVYLFNGVTGALLSSLVGSHPNDRVGALDAFSNWSGVSPLSNGNYLVQSAVWNGIRGAVTWGSGATGVSGIVSAANSLVGSNPNDSVGYYGITVLSNDNYLVRSPGWNGGRGEVTWGSGTTGVSGVVSEANSLVGTNPADGVGAAYIILLSHGNYLVQDLSWHGGRGAVTWGSGTTGVSGVVSEANSLVGTNPGDYVGAVDPSGEYAILVLSNGDYLVRSPSWNGSRGAVTWGSGTTGISGFVSEANSLVGSNPNDRVGAFTPSGDLGIIQLTNGNYLVNSPSWGGARGAVTWVSGPEGFRGAVSEANSLVGSSPGDGVGSSGVVLLSNGNYLVRSPSWNGARGAVTWGSSTAGVRGAVSEASSLVGSSPGDGVGSSGVVLLSNGNYLVRSPSWNGARGAVTWGSSTAGVRGAVSEASSLVGSNRGDSLGLGSYGSGITLLSNGDSLVRSPSWNGNRGAVTWVSGPEGFRGVVSEANSLVGSNPNDRVGYSDITVLSNGNYLVRSPFWNGNRGEVTWGNATMGISGIVSEANSLVGSNPADGVGSSEIGVLNNGNYVVTSPSWSGSRGAVTWGSGATGVSGVVSEANSLVGTNPADGVGAIDRFGDSGITVLSNGNYLVRSLLWNGNRGAVTWGRGTTGISGVVSEANSLVGSNPNDYVGAYGLTVLSNGNYLVRSSSWDGARGAVTWGGGTTGVSGVVSEANSLVGTNPGDGVGAIDRFGASGIIVLSNGNYLVGSALWNGNRGAVTWGSGTTGISGVVSETNSLVGSNPNDSVGAITDMSTSSGVTVLSNGNYLVRSPFWTGHRGAATWGSGTTGVNGIVSEANSLVGSNPNDRVGSYGLTVLSNGNYLVSSLSWDGARGAVTWGSGTTGISGIVSEANSLVGSNPNDGVGYNGITVLSNGNYLVRSRLWNGNRGAVTWASGTTGQTLDGRYTITAQNSLVGRVVNAGLDATVFGPNQQTILAPFTTDGGGRVSVGLTDPNLLGYARGQSQTITIAPDFLTRTLNAGTAVVLQASNDITVNSPITVSAGGQGGALTLQAGRSILLNASISTDNGALTLIANDRLANGVVDGQRDPGPAVIAVASGTALNMGSGALTVELRDGAGLSNPESGAITLQAVTAGSLSVVNNGPSAGSDVNLAAVWTSGPQTYRSPQGLTVVTAELFASDRSIAFADSVVVSAGVSVGAGASLVTFAGSGTQTLQSGDGAQFSNLSHTGAGALQLLGGLEVAGTLVQSAGTFDANAQAVTVGRAALLTDGTYLAGTAPQAFAGGLVIAGGAFTSSTGPMTVRGGVTLTGGSFAGAGTVDALTVYRGTVTPGPGVLAVGGGVGFDVLTTFSAVLNGTDPEGGYGTVVAGGTVDLGGSTLSLTLGFTPLVGDSFALLTTGDGSAVSGTFAGLDEGATFTQDGLTFQITYQGGPGGNSVVLTCLG